MNLEKTQDHFASQANSFSSWRWSACLGQMLPAGVGSICPLVQYCLLSACLVACSCSLSIQYCCSTLASLITTFSSGVESRVILCRFQEIAAAVACSHSLNSKPFSSAGTLKVSPIASKCSSCDSMKYPVMLCRCEEAFWALL